MSLNLDAVGSTSEPVRRSWNSTDCLLYALGVGAGSLDAALELEFTTENSSDLPQKVLPTFATVVGAGGPPRSSIGAFDPAMLVHAEQSVELFGAIPTCAEITATSTITAIYDKGSGALVRSEATTVDTTGRPLFRTGTGLFIRGAGGFGGERGKSRAGEPLPPRPPDAIVTCPTRPDQALLYRLSGDRNPLHSDPGFARRAGFDRPILHGLCTFGFTGRALLHTLCDSEPSRFGSMYGRFSRPTFPGDTLTVSIWVDGQTARFRTQNQSGETVIDAGSCELLLAPSTVVSTGTMGKLAS
jgi:acyl dehydratase